MTTQFHAAIRELYDEEVEFIIVGAFAAVLQGSVIATSDLDICYRRTPANLKRLTRALVKLGAKLRGADEAPFILDEKSLTQGMNFTFVTNVGDLDVLGQLSGVGGYDELSADAISIEIEGMRCQAASLGALIKSKRAAGRNKDKFALPELEALEQAQMKKN